MDGLLSIWSGLVNVAYGVIVVAVTVVAAIIVTTISFNCTIFDRFFL
jgi:hypothetical protein